MTLFDQSEIDALLATASADQTARVWELDTGRERVRVEHKDRVSAVAFNPAGTHLATSSWDGTVRLWALDRNEETARLTHTDRVHTLAFSADGTYLASASWDEATVALRPLTPEKLVQAACRRVPRPLSEAEWARYLGDRTYRQSCEGR